MYKMKEIINKTSVFTYSLLQLLSNKGNLQSRQHKNIFKSLQNFCYSFCNMTMFDYKQSEILQTYQRYKTQSSLSMNSELGLANIIDDNTLQEVWLEEEGSHCNNIQVEECELWRTIPIILGNK